MKEKDTSLKTRGRSFLYAWQGLKTALKEEANMQIHLLVGVIVIVAGFLFKLSHLEWLFVIFAITTVFAGELFNACIEDICDFVSPGKHDRIKRVKDMAAAAVLLLAIGAFCGGVIIFLPKIIALFH